MREATTLGDGVAAEEEEEEEDGADTMTHRHHTTTMRQENRACRQPQQARRVSRGGDQASGRECWVGPRQAIWPGIEGSLSHSGHRALVVGAINGMADSGEMMPGKAAPPGAAVRGIPATLVPRRLHLRDTIALGLDRRAGDRY